MDKFNPDSSTVAGLGHSALLSHGTKTAIHTSDAYDKEDEIALAAAIALSEPVLIQA